MDSSQPVGVVALRVLSLAVLMLLSALTYAQGTHSSADSTLSQRSFSEPASKIQTAVDKLRPTFSGHLPTLDGFVAGQQYFEHYQRPYYHCTVHVTSTAAGASLVRVTAKITAWHEGAPHAGYEVLQSNGRLESDLLDRLQDSLASKAHTETKASPEPNISAPMPQLPKHSAGISASDTSKPQDSTLDEEARGLAEIFRSQSHPTNLVAVRRDQTPVLESPSVDGKVLFLASAEDEFEVLDANPEWVHVRISGLSRGWLRRSTAEILNGSQAAQIEQPSTKKTVESPTVLASASFSVSSEEVGIFPGTWGPLKGKNAKIISVQQAAGTGRITSPQDKLRFAGSVFGKEVLPAGADGLVLIFDAEDGGMIASTRGALEQWRRGTISEENFWKQCLLDPPEILGASN